MYAILGATGHTGKRIAENLLAAGKEVRVIGRSADTLQPLVSKGAKAFVGDAHDADFLTKAFTGADTVYALLPPNQQTEDFSKHADSAGEAIASAIENAGVKYVVTLSSQGAHKPDNNGPVAGLYRLEQRLNKIEGLNVMHLRPAYFMENLFGNIGIIKQMGVNGSPLKSDVPLPLIATQDIAEAATQHLLKKDFTGKNHHDLLGERDLTMNEITGVFGKAIGKDELQYVQFPYEDAKKGMLQWGISGNMADAYIELNKSINEGTYSEEIQRDAHNTTKTSIEDFAQHFAAAYKNS